MFTKEMLNSIRKGLQIQLAAIGLNRVPAFLELNSDQIIHLAQKLTETNFPRGTPSRQETSLWVSPKVSLLKFSYDMEMRTLSVFPEYLE